MTPKLTEAAPGVFHVEGAHTNWQFIVEDGAVCLVDTGWPRDFRDVEASLARAGRSPGDVVAIVLTHAHVDHLGTARRVHEVSGAPILVHPDEEAHALGRRIEQARPLDLLLRCWRPHVLRFVAGIAWHGAQRARRPSHVETFPEGVALEVPGRPVPVPTPGHTSGHCAFLLTGAGAVLSGDALVTVDLLTGAPGPRLMPPVFEHEPERSRASLARLAALDAELVLPGHGAPYHGSPADAVAEALGRLDGRAVAGGAARA